MCWSCGPWMGNHPLAQPAWGGVVTELEAVAPALARRRAHLRIEGSEEAPDRARRRRSTTVDGRVSDACGQFQLPA